MSSSGSNIFFNNFESSAEQDLIESLIVESISIYGHGVYFCPRTLVARDDVFSEDSLSTYDKAYPTDLYIRSYDSYEGDGTFLSKFNLEIRDQITFSLAIRTFKNTIAPTSGLIRPREGDLIYSKMMKRMFVIKYVNPYSVFYQMGALQTWDLVCEVFEYSNERFNTGIAEIDAIETDYSVANVSSNSAYANAMGTFATNEDFQNEGNTVIDWSELDPFSDGNI